MNKTFLLSGGAGRIITAIPALERYYHENGETFNVVVYGWSNLYNCHPILHNRTYDINNRGIFELMIKGSELICPEPYHVPDYYNQRINLISAFDCCINGYYELNNKKVNLYLHSNEDFTAKKMIQDALKQFKKEKFIVFQPYGSGMQEVNGKYIDKSERSLYKEAAEYIAGTLSRDAVVLYFGDNKYAPNIPGVLNTKDIPGADLRFFMAMIANCDYFVGIDSVGQHMAAAFGKSGTIFMGSTFEENVTYPYWFKIIRKQNMKPYYSPIRISPVDVDYAEIGNDGIMNFTIDEINEALEK